MEHLISAVVGLVAGAVGSLVAPWVNWRIEKKRERLKYRKSKLEEWRDFIHSIGDGGELAGSVEYSEMRRHLSRRSRDAAEGTNLTIRLGRGGNVVNNLILDDLSELESKWGLL